jgi:hypothetical protein
MGMLRREKIQVNALFPNPRAARDCEIGATKTCRTLKLESWSCLAAIRRSVLVES